jgi:hypothetical protein
VLVAVLEIIIILRVVVSMEVELEHKVDLV